MVNKKLNEFEMEMCDLMGTLHEMKHGENGILLHKCLQKFRGFIEIYNPYNWKYIKGMI